jgi:hypothetical protein
VETKNPSNQQASKLSPPNAPAATLSSAAPETQTEKKAKKQKLNGGSSAAAKTFDREKALAMLRDLFANSKPDTPPPAAEDSDVDESDDDVSEEEEEEEEEEDEEEEEEETEADDEDGEQMVESDEEAPRTPNKNLTAAQLRELQRKECEEMNQKEQTKKTKSKTTKASKTKVATKPPPKLRGKRKLSATTDSPSDDEVEAPSPAAAAKAGAKAGAKTKGKGAATPKKETKATAAKREKAEAAKREKAEAKAKAKAEKEALKAEKVSRRTGQDVPFPPHLTLLLSSPAQKAAKVAEKAKKRRTASSPNPSGGNDHWVRRSVREPGQFELSAPKVLDLLEDITLDKESCAVLKLKKWLGPDTISIVMDVVLDALVDNTLCQALYIQNFNVAMRDGQMLKLLKVLQQGRIWSLNIGETYKVSNETWEKFTDGLRQTNVTHM